MNRPDMKTILIAIAGLFLSGTAQAESQYIEENKIPMEIRKFILPGTHLLAMESADLNGDNLADYILVLEKPDVEEEQRPLLIITRSADGSLKRVKQNNKAVYCSNCGGMMGDPFQDVSVGPKTFTINHYGGSGWRWSTSTTFNYSRKDKTWQLVGVETSSFHAADHEKVETKHHKPPRDFGKIDIADFDPDNYLKKK